MIIMTMEMMMMMKNAIVPSIHPSRVLSHGSDGYLFITGFMTCYNKVGFISFAKLECVCTNFFFFFSNLW